MESHVDTNENTLFGFWVYLMTDFILFATLFAAYAVVRVPAAGLLDLPFALKETIVLMSSAFSCAMAVWAVKRNSAPKTMGWFAVTFVLGVAFLCMIYAECAHLYAEGNTWQKNAYLSSYYTLIGTHGLHIVFGLIFMALFNAQVYVRGLTPVTTRKLHCVAMFWFFSYVVWIFMFTIVYLIGAS